jgi:hypothetical protein
MFVGEHETCGAYYEGESLDLDGRVWMNCIFRHCDLHRNDPKTELWNSIYDECTFEGAGWEYFSGQVPVFIP